MAKLFIGLAIAVMLAAAVLGFLAKGNIDTLQSVLRETKQTLARTKATLETREAELAKTREELKVAEAKIEQQTTEIAGLNKDKMELTVKLSTTEMERDKFKTDFEAAEKKMADMAGKPGEVVDLVALKAKMEQTAAELAKATAERDEQKQMAETLKRAKDEGDEKLATANKEIERYRAGVTKAGLTGKILAVNPGWNFVVLSVGDRQGAATGGIMIVTRGGEAIGRVRITSIEPSTSIADIIPGSVRRGVTVQPGDTVVYEGPRTKPAPGAAPGVGAPAAVVPAS